MYYAVGGKRVDPVVVDGIGTVFRLQHPTNSLAGVLGDLQHRRKRMLRYTNRAGRNYPSLLCRAPAERVRIRLAPTPDRHDPQYTVVQQHRMKHLPQRLPCGARRAPLAGGNLDASGHADIAKEAARTIPGACRNRSKNTTTTYYCIWESLSYGTSLGRLLAVLAEISRDASFNFFRTKKHI